MDGWKVLGAKMWNLRKKVKLKVEGQVVRFFQNKKVTYWSHAESPELEPLSGMRALAWNNYQPGTKTWIINFIHFFQILFKRFLKGDFFLPRLPVLTLQVSEEKVNIRHFIRSPNQNCFLKVHVIPNIWSAWNTKHFLGIYKACSYVEYTHKVGCCQRFYVITTNKSTSGKSQHLYVLTRKKNTSGKCPINWRQQAYLGVKNEP